MGESVAGRLFSVLDAFEGGGPAALRLTDIAARTGLPAPTALRLVRELVAWGGLERGADGRYRLGIRLRVLGSAAPCPRGSSTRRSRRCGRWGSGPAATRIWRSSPLRRRARCSAW
ncbi:helix-turn-helix domain-containing protein [Streptomyces sp. NPDC002394]